MGERLGQHFLGDSEVIAEVASALPLEGKRVLEIGAGTGVLTVALAAKKPRKLVALETDEELIPRLREKVAHFDNVQIVCADLRNYSFKGFDLVVGNIPFYLSSLILFKALESKADGLFLVQREFAQRLVAKPGSPDWGRLSVNAQNKSDVSVVLEVSRYSFSPPPEVDASVVVLKRKKPMAIDEKLVEALFSHKNQKVKKAFEHSAHIFGLEKKEAKAAAVKLPFAEYRVKDLTLGQWVELSAGAARRSNGK